MGAVVVRNNPKRRFLSLMLFLTLRLVLKPQFELGERFGRLRGRNRQAFPFFLSRKSEETTFSASETAQKPLAYIFAGIWAVP